MFPRTLFLLALCCALPLSGSPACASPASPPAPPRTSGADSAELRRLVEKDADELRGFVIRNGISFLPGPEYPAQKAACEEAYRIVLALLDILDGDAPAQALRDIAACRAAGVVHPPQHAIAETAIRLPSWPWEEKEAIVRDRHAVLGGLFAAQRDFALVFGRPEDFLRENTPLRIAWSPARGLPAPPSPEEARILRSRPFSEQAASVAETCRTREYTLLIREAARSLPHLRLLGAYLYGIYVETCHLASLLPPEESACAAAPACLALRRGTADRLGRGLELLGKEGMLGNGTENERRAALVARLQRLLAADDATTPAVPLRKIASLTREERARILRPFLP